MNSHQLIRRTLIQGFAAGAVLPLGASLHAAGSAQPVDVTWTDPARNRQLPLRLRWPGPAAAPTGALVLFSHGIGGTREGGQVWGEAWASAGFTVIHLQHPGSDLDSVRRAGNPAAAATGQQIMQRLLDVRFVVDEVLRQRKAGAPGWSAIRPEAIGLAGHSFGAHTTLGAAGQKYPGPRLADERLSAFIALSPLLPKHNPEQALSSITRPMLCITGTLDGEVMGNGATPERRRAVYDALPAGHKASLVLAGADHMTFGGAAARAGSQRSADRPVESVQREPSHHAVVAALTTSWWHLHLLGDSSARSRMKNPQGLTPADEWRQG